jgi:hypothetical protein
MSAALLAKVGFSYSYRLLTLEMSQPVSEPSSDLSALPCD